MASHTRQMRPHSRLMRTMLADREYRAALVRLPSPKAALARLVVKIERQRRIGASKTWHERAALLIQR